MPRAPLVADYIAELGDIDSAVVVMRGADGALCHITNSRRRNFGYDQRLEAFGSAGMLSVGNQHATSVRLFNATQTEAAREYLNFFLDRYTPAYRAELDHLITSMEQGSQPSPGFPTDGRRWFWPMRHLKVSGQVEWCDSASRKLWTLSRHDFGRLNRVITLTPVVRASGETCSRSRAALFPVLAVGSRPGPVKLRSVM
jgi:hypothetical protein